MFSKFLSHSFPPSLFSFSFSGYPLFPGEDEIDQLACIIELQGMPPQRLLDQCKRVKAFFNSKGYPRYCVLETDADGSPVLKAGRSRRGKLRGPPASKDMVTALKGCEDPYFLDFMRRCLQWNPDERMTPREALRHDWLRRRLPKPPQLGTGDATNHAYRSGGPAEPSKTSGDRRRPVEEVAARLKQTHVGATL